MDTELQARMRMECVRIANAMAERSGVSHYHVANAAAELWRFIETGHSDVDRLANFQAMAAQVIKPRAV